MKLNNVYGSQIIERGERYTHNVNYCIKIGGFLYSEVEGTSTYKTKVDLKSLHGDCSCPYGTNCKHAVATLLVHEEGDSINADKFIEHLNSLSKRELVKIIVDNLHNNPDIALSFDLKKSTNFESFVNDFIDDFSYSKMNKAEKIASSFTFDQLMRMLNYLFENEDDVFDKIYEDYYDSYDEGDVLYDFESKLKEELVNNITNEKEIKQALKIGALHDDIIYGSQKLIKFKEIIKSAFSKEQFMNFLLNLENPDLNEIQQAITKNNINSIYYLPSHKMELAEKIAKHIKDKKLLFIVAVYKDDFKGIIDNLQEFTGIVPDNYHILDRKLSDIVDVFIEHNFKDKKTAKKFLQNDFLENYNEKHIRFLAKQIDDYKFIKQLIDFKEEFSQNKILLERLFELDKNTTNNFLKNVKNLLEDKHWTEMVDILSYFRQKFGDDYIIKTIQKNEKLFRTSSTLKSNLKKRGIHIGYIKGNLEVQII
ncbi:SWIM zinc finger family protein [Candidatus Woesearchaeota archaeon]|nr:SWIM zinc finger family protein [Candidatus Woesearchaeota archaeon]